MIDYDKIGKRIQEERKFIRHISQERMAEELNMYQADISNLEKAKGGSGITDLSKLDQIADYFDIPLEYLIFGGDERDIVQYYGKDAGFKNSKRMRKKHQKILAKLTGQPEDQLEATILEWGPYVAYNMTEYQLSFGAGSRIAEGDINPNFILPKCHTFIFLKDEIIAAFTADVTIVMQHVFQPHLHALQQMIQFDKLDVTDVWRTLNPYWALWQFTDEPKEEQIYQNKMHDRMDAIRETGAEDNVLYIESGYVREDYRRHGVFRLYIDILKEMYRDSIIWLNMEPTSGSELSHEYNKLPSYTTSELGQLSLNAAIAEKTGFTVDPDTWHRQAEVMKADGTVHTDVLLVRKCAYYLPEKWRQLLKDDGDLVALGRAKQKVFYRNADEKAAVDIKTGSYGDYYVAEWMESCISGKNIGKKTVVYAAYNLKNKGEYLFGVEKDSVFNKGFHQADEIESYQYLDDATESEYFEQMSMMNNYIIMKLQAGSETDNKAKEQNETK